jgi:hypothetical protein
LISDVGRNFRKNSVWNSSKLAPAPSAATKSTTPRDLVGPGSTLFTVIPEPATASASPRATAIWAALVTP